MIKNVICGQCGQHCLANVRVEDGRVLEQFFPKTSGSRQQELRRAVVTSCARARSVPELIDHPDRINYPLRRTGERGQNKWQRVTWEEALDDIASRLEHLKQKYGPESVAVATMGENNCCEEFRVRFMSLLGTPTHVNQGQICFCAFNMIGMAIMGGTTYFYHPSELTKCLLMIGINPTNSWRYNWYRIRDFQKNGMKLIVIDPRVSEAAAIADIHLQLQPGTDVALLLGMINVIIEEDLYDQQFVDKYCYGFEKLAQRLKDYPVERVSGITGVPVDQIREAGRMYATNRPGIVYNGMGIEHIPNASQAAQARYILPAITGNIDVPGGEILLSPHPTVGLVADLELHDALSPEQKAKLIGSREFPLFSSWETLRMIEKNVMKVRNRRLSSLWLGGMGHSPSIWRAMLRSEPFPVKGMLCVDTNPLLTYPNPKLIYEAMKGLDIYVNMDIFMTPSALMADYVLPAACYLEKPFMTAGDYFPHFVVGEAAINPMYERQGEFYFWRELGLRLGQTEYWPWKSQEESYEYRLSPMGLTFEQAVRQKFQSSRPEFKKYEKVGFGTPTGKVELYCTTMEELGFDPLPSYTEWPFGASSSLFPKYPLTLITGARNRDYNQSQQRQIASVRKKSPDPIAELHPSKAQELGINNGDWIWIENDLGRVKFKCRYSDRLLPNVVNAEHGWWFPEEPAEAPSLHGVWQSNINVLLDDDPKTCDPRNGVWVLKGVMCRVYKVQD